jgi:NAD(P)H-hydrate repair Nnr-like enzyme with NAD(P)H-hydrate epimerase domain
MKILTTSQIRALDAYTIAHEPVSEIKLMERAAEAFVSAFAASHTRSAPIHVFCGKGNNGGDGLAIARLLKTSWRKVHLYVLDTGKKKQPLLRYQSQ